MLLLTSEMAGVESVDSLSGTAEFVFSMKYHDKDVAGLIKLLWNSKDILD